MRMKFSVVFLTGFALWLLAGCRQNADQVAPPADAATLDRIRRETTRLDPSAMVGKVIGIESHGAGLAVVGEISTKDFQVGDVIEFVDSHRQTLTNGVTRQVSDDVVYVEWLRPTATGRAPRVGDVAIRYRQPATKPS